LIAINPVRTEVFAALTILNAVIYGAFYFRHRDNRLPLHLMVISVIALVAGLPEAWIRGFGPELMRSKCIAAGAAVYLLFFSTMSRNPMLGILGALISASAGFFVLGNNPNSPHWAAQIGFAFLLLHSLRWVDEQHLGAKTVRVLASLLWIAHAFVWMHLGGAAWMTCAVAAFTFGIFAGFRLLAGWWGPRVVPIGAVLVALSGPLDFIVGKLLNAPLGLLAVLGSFVLFGLGTLAALTRHRWHSPGTGGAGSLELAGPGIGCAVPPKQRLRTDPNA
jgi:hypothetical protein